MGVISGLIGGLLARRSFKAIWRVVDDREPPQPDQRLVSLPKLVLALSIEGAVFRLVKGLVDRASRRSFAVVMGRWPGDDGPEPS